ncbi:MAG: hypothetical protein CMH44_00535 [Muricauda sp.]|nr:hypothetical protein [Allomuricauda sp.]
MNHKLMSEKIEIDPLLGTSTFFATKNFTVKYSAFIKVVNRYGNMKRSYFLHGVFFLKSRTTLSSFQK